MRFVGWKNLRMLRDLRYLDVLPETAFDARLIAGLERLKVLHIFSGSLKHAEALAMLPALNTLGLRDRDDLTDVSFAKSLAQIRALQIEGTGVRDLKPLSDLTRLEIVDANRSLVDHLPSGALPALKQLDVVGTPVTEQAVAAFRQAHPGVRVRRGWNESLRDALLGVTRLRIGPGEACGLEEPPPPPYESTDPAEIAGLLRLFVVDEDRSGAICGCLGGASFEFFSRDQLLETTHLVCNRMLRWSGWPGDGALAPAKVRARRGHRRAGARSCARALSRTETPPLRTRATNPASSRSCCHPSYPLRRIVSESCCGSSARTQVPGVALTGRRSWLRSSSAPTAGASRQATRWWEPERVAAALKTMLLPHPKATHTLDTEKATS